MAVSPTSLYVPADPTHSSAYRQIISALLPGLSFTDISFISLIVPKYPFHNPHTLPLPGAELFGRIEKKEMNMVATNFKAINIRDYKTIFSFD